MNRGYITLMSVLVLGAIGLAITTSLLLLGVDATHSSLSMTAADQAKGLADACAEEALQQIHDSTAYTGTGTLAMGQGSCTYTVTSQGGQDRTITASGTVDSVVRKVKAVINQITPKIRVVSWQEVADFI